MLDEIWETRKRRECLGILSLCQEKTLKTTKMPRKSSKPQNIRKSSNCTTFTEMSWARNTLGCSKKKKKWLHKAFYAWSITTNAVHSPWKMASALFFVVWQGPCECSLPLDLTYEEAAWVPASRVWRNEANGKWSKESGNLHLKRFQVIAPCLEREKA